MSTNELIEVVLKAISDCKVNIPENTFSERQSLCRYITRQIDNIAFNTFSRNAGAICDVCTLNTIWWDFKDRNKQIGNSILNITNVIANNYCK